MKIFDPKLTGSIEFQSPVVGPGITSSLFGTASWAINAITASYILNSVSSSFASTASYVTTAQTASFVTLARTASYVQTAQTASYILNAVSSSFASTASFVALAQTASFVTLAQSASYVLQAVSSSFASTASYAQNAVSSAFATNAATASSADSFVVRGSLTGSDALFTGTITAQRLSVQYITASTEFITGSTKFGTQLTDTHQFTGSVSITGSLTVEGILNATSSWAQNSVTASYVLNAVSSSFASTASYVLQSVSSSFASTASFVQLAQTASFVTTAQTASFVQTAQTASYVQLAQSASYVLNAVSSSFASTASFVTLAQSASFVATASWAINVVNGSSTSDFPYTGSARITGSLNVAGPVTVTGSILVTQSYISTVDWIDFTVQPNTPPFLEGRVHWTDVSKTLELDTDVNNFSIPVGHASVLRGRNTNSFTLTKGTVVYINGNSGQFPTLATASWENDPNSAYTIGIVAQDINTNQYGYAVTDGEIRGINTNAYAPSTLLYLSASGQYTDQVPVAPLHTVRLGQVVVQSTDGILQVKIDNGYELNELHDVLAQTTFTGDLLVRSGSLWINSRQLTGSYGVTGSITVLGHIAVNADTLDPIYPQALLVSGSTLNIISGEAAIDDYAQLNIINKFAGANSSADIVATNDAASEFGNYVDLGINSSNYGGAIGDNNEAYLYNTGSNFLIGNITRGENANVKFFAGNDATVFPLIVTGSVIIATGSLSGTSSFATTASYALNGGVTQIIAGTNVSISPTNGLGAVTITSTGGSGDAFPFTGSAQITGSLGITGSLSISGSGINILDTTRITGSLGITGSTSLIGTFRFNETTDPGGATTNAVFLFASRSEDGVDTDWYYRHSGNLWNFDWYENIVDTGLIYGGIVTITGSAGVDTPPNTTQIRITSGLGLFVDHNATTSSKGETVAQLVPFGPFTQSFTDYITSSQAAYIYVDTAGQLQYQSSIFTTDQYHQAFPLGVFFALTTSSIASWGDLRVTNYGQQQQAGEFIRAFGPLKVNGFNITAQSGSLSASIAAGKTFRFGGFYTQDPDSPSIYDSAAIPTASFVRVYQDPSVIGGFRATTNNGIPFRAVDPSQWDDGSGTLQTVGSGEFTIQRIFQAAVNGISYIYYGQNKYTSLAAAIQNVTTENFNESQTSIVNLPFIGYVIAEGTATNLADTGSARIINSGLFRNTAGSSGGGGASVTALDDLSDVALTVPTNGQALVYQSGVWINSDPKTAATASYLNNLNQQLSITGGLILTGSSTNAELLVVGQTVFTGSVIMTASRGQTADELTVIGGVCITGSLVVSGSGGYGVFSKGITLADLTNGFDVTGSYFVWRAPYPATVVGLWAIKSGSSNISVNARRSGSGASQHLASNLVVSANNLWSSGGTVQNTAYSAGDSLEIIFSGSSVIETSIQVDFIKR